MTLLLPLLATIGLAQAQCPATAEQLAEQLAAGLAAFEQMDAEAFRLAREGAQERLGCVDRALSMEEAAEYHLLMALDAYLSQDPERTVAALRSVVALRPSYKLPRNLAPPGNLLLELHREARKPLYAPQMALLEVQQASFYVDGQQALERPSERPAVLQLLSESGEVAWSGYLPTGAHLPVSVIAAVTEEDRMVVYEGGVPKPAPEPLVPEVGTESEPQGPSRALAFGAGGAAVAAAGLLTAALVARSRWLENVEECVVWDGCADNSDSALEQQEQLASSARALGYGAQATGGVALGLGVAAVLTVKW